MNAEAELIKRHLAGDEAASQALIEAHQDRVYNLAWRMLGDAEAARDAAQEAFLYALEALPGFRGECAFSTWLYRIAANACLARSKLRKRRGVMERSADDGDFPADSGPSPLDCTEIGERNARLHAAISELDEPYRLVVVLHYFQGLAYDEVARVLTVPEGTVKVRMYRAKRLLQRKLRARGEGSFT